MNTSTGTLHIDNNMPNSNLTNSSRADRPFQTVDELALMLHVSKTTVYRLVESRQIPFYRVSGSLRFSYEDIQSYLHKNRFGPVS